MRRASLEPGVPLEQHSVRDLNRPPLVPLVFSLVSSPDFSLTTSRNTRAGAVNIVVPPIIRFPPPWTLTWHGECHHAHLSLVHTYLPTHIPTQLHLCLYLPTYSRIHT